MPVEQIVIIILIVMNIKFRDYIKYFKSNETPSLINSKAVFLQTYMYASLWTKESATLAKRYFQQLYQ